MRPEVRVWILNHYAVTPDQPGGTRHFDLSRELVRRGHEVTILASSFHHYQRRYLRETPDTGWAVEVVDGVRFLWLRTCSYGGNGWRRGWSLVDYWRMARRWGRRLAAEGGPLAPPPDVVLGTSVHLLAVLAGRQLADRFGVPFAMEVRDLWPQTLVDIGSIGHRHPATLMLRLLETHLYRRAVRIITPLPMAHEYITRLGIPRERVVWIPNGVDLARYPDPSAGGDPEHEGFRVMYLGSHGPANDLRVLLGAALEIQRRGVDDVRFVLVGDGPLKAELVREAGAMGLRNTEFRDPVVKSAVPAILREADVTTFVLADLPLYRFGVSLNKTFDYLAAGKPLILAGRPRNNIVAEADCGLSVPPGDPLALAGAILRMRSLPPAEREAMGRRGRRHMEEEYDIRRLAERLEGCLEACIMPGAGEERGRREDGLGEGG